MVNAIIRVFVFLMVLIGIFIYVGHTITVMTGGGGHVVVEGVNIEAGESIFFGKGKCSTCHSIGDKGSAIRCPNLGVQGEKFPLAIGERIAERAAERAKKTGKEYKPVDYLWETIGDPGAYVVEGFKNEMPAVYKPPISLSPDEVKAVIMFLASQGGEIPSEHITSPTGVGKEWFAKIEAASDSGQAQAAPFKPYLVGDVENGKKLFWDVDSKAGCAKCHAVGDKGGHVGPALTNVAGTRTLPYIVESIVDASAVIVSGYEPILIMTNDRKRVSGTKKEDTDDHFTVGLSNGEVVTIQKSDVKKFKMQKKSIMPGNFAEILTVDDFHDILAYLQTLT